MTNLTYTISQDIEAILRDPNFSERTAEFSLQRFQDTLIAEMKTRKVSAHLIYVKSAPPGLEGDHLVRWQPVDGGNYQTTWFSRANPAP